MSDAACTVTASPCVAGPASRGTGIDTVRSGNAAPAAVGPGREHTFAGVEAHVQPDPVTVAGNGSENVTDTAPEADAAPPFDTRATNVDVEPGRRGWPETQLATTSTFEDAESVTGTLTNVSLFVVIESDDDDTRALTPNEPTAPTPTGTAATRGGSDAPAAIGPAYEQFTGHESAQVQPDPDIIKPPACPFADRATVTGPVPV